MKPLILLLLTLLTACGSVPAKAPPPVFTCPDACETPCVGADGDTGLRWEGNPEDAAAWDELGGSVLDQLIQKLRTCEVNRKTCAKCIQNAKDQGIIQ